MELETLRWALHGTAAYRHVVEEEPLQKVLMLLDKLAAGDGAGAAEDYARLFYTLRTEEKTSLGEWLDGQLRDRESPRDRTHHPPTGMPGGGRTAPPRGCGRTPSAPQR